MTDTMDNFSALLGGRPIKPVRGNDKSPDFYRAKPEVSQEKRQLAENFEHAAVSQANYDIGAEDEIEYRADGVQRNLLKQLAKGEIPPFESIDLHGMTTMEAEIYMATTIDNQRYHHMSCIRIVHGKGYHVGDSPDNKPAPKLKNFTARYLTEHPRVLAFSSCPIHHGGAGAVYVLLSRFDNP